MEKKICVYLLLQYNKKTGKVFKEMDAYGNALMRMWALNNTPKSRNTVIINCETGDCEWLFEGKENDMPTVKQNVGICDDFGIDRKMLESIANSR